MKTTKLCAVALLLLGSFLCAVLASGRGAAVAPDSAADEPYMKIELPSQLRTRGIVVAAPHAGFDLHTEKLAQQVGESIGAPVVIAWNYRKPGRSRFINVNRPTAEKVGSDGGRGPERETPEATRVFGEWLEWVRKAADRAGAPPSQPVPLYVEIHGNNRKVKVDGRGELTVDRVEVATLGFQPSELRALVECWQQERTANPVLPAIAFDELHPRYDEDGVRVSFYFRASGAREAGILRSSHVSRALHFELPRRVRFSRAARAEVAAAISRLLEKAAELLQERTTTIRD